ncbi:ATP-grasp domain-containing protein [Curtobacterium sp. MCBD17_021]|uniref:D-alanine--D-alanine ligase family protein n=1 Tax=Curtobacterium sp. MCBD17_021 TaxID=2175665 RepID=UPI000DA91438|nr:ATP-grasp domain-containing protein [Curtobacterium sp. MCBD17_021]PZE61844.1 D-alanine--D-alanine ligase [Curtobacterium sp. MCBD17_021]
MHDRGALRIAVVGGGANDEHEVSLASAAATVRAVTGLGLEAVSLTVARDGGWLHTAGGPMTASEAVEVLTSCDALFPVLHGVDGEDGAIAGLARMIGVPVVGSPVRAGALGMDKWVTKTLAEALGIHTAPGVLVRPEDESALPLGLPFVVKPTTGGSSNGVSVVRHPADYAAALATARAAGTDTLVERFIAGREVDIAVFRDATGALRTGATLEIGVRPGDVFDRTQKYDGTAAFTIPARISPAEHTEVERAATVLYAALGCAGVARFDFFVTDDGVVLNEVNTAPGFTEQSQVPRMFAAVGLPYAELVGELIAATVAWGPEPSRSTDPASPTGRRTERWRSS